MYETKKKNPDPSEQIEQTKQQSLKKKTKIKHSISEQGESEAIKIIDIDQSEIQKM